MIRTSKHFWKFLNIGKNQRYQEFLKEYRRVSVLYLDFLWDNGWIWKDKKGNIHTMDISKDILEHPRMIDKSINTILKLETDLSARALKCCITQVCGIVGASLKKQNKRLYIKNKLEKEGKEVSEGLLRKIAQNKPRKPYIGNLNPELNSICIEYKEENTNSVKKANGYIQLKSLGKRYGKIVIPIKYHRQSNKLKSKGNLLTSFLCHNNHIEFRWEIEVPKKTTGKTVGADQGYKTVLTLSDKQATPKENDWEYSLEEVIGILSRKKKGSKNFLQTQKHRDNVINWMLNQLNLDDVQKVKLEKIVNINYGRRVSRRMKHWVNTLIRDKLKRRCEELGVQVIEQSSVYRSQRCSGCGLVRKANRKGKEYKCECGACLDSDLNAALNHEQELPSIPLAFRKNKFNLGKGFYWKSNGLFKRSGEALTVPPPTIKPK